MSSIWTRSVNASPKFDCGLCGYPKCASFTRAVLLDFASIDDCPLLKLNEFSGLYSELENLVQRKMGLKMRTATELPDGGVLLTRPCKDTDQKVMAELRVHNGVPIGETIRYGVFDSTLLCDYSECLSDFFEVVKCSRDLGYGRADTGEMSITLLQDGRINMRRVDNRESVLKTFSVIEAAILGSTICNCCGNDLVSIASGLVTHQDAHTVLKAGSSICLDPQTVSKPLTRKLFVDEFHESTIAAQIDLSFQLVDDFLRSVFERTTIDETAMVDLQKMQCQVISLVRSKNNEKRETILLKTLGLLWVLSSAFEALTRIEELLRPLPYERKDRASQLLLDVSRDGNIEEPELADESLYQIYAHSLRLVRCFKKRDVWFG